MNLIREKEWACSTIKQFSGRDWLNDRTARREELHFRLAARAIALRGRLLTRGRVVLSGGSSESNVEASACTSNEQRFRRSEVTAVGYEVWLQPRAQLSQDALDTVADQDEAS